MRKNVTLALFFIVIACIIAVFVIKHRVSKADNNKVPSSIVIPQLSTDDSKKDVNFSSSDEEASMFSLLPLNDNETLISLVSMDFDGDGFDDQVNVIKTMDSPYISLLIGLYNPNKNIYERKSIIATEISQVLTFSYTGIDLTGEHKISLVYQGFANNGDSILQAFFISNVNGQFSLRQIADLRGDGTVFIQQLDRYDAYERTNAKGSSFPIWVYTSDTENGSSDQLQIQYDWNENEYKYVQTKVIRVTGNRIAAKELSRIQDGTVATFASFLNGLWYMSDGMSDSEGRYVFFDYEAKEIIFFKDDTEEVYKWLNSNIRRNGIYISSINQEIENLNRRIDVSLKSIDEIHIRIQDDVRMLISESAVWNGDYKKTNKNLFMQKVKEKSKNFVDVFEKENSWKTLDGAIIKFNNGRYTLTSDRTNEEGFYTFFDKNGDSFIQFRVDSNDSKSSDFKYFSGLYKLVVDENSNAAKYFLQPSKILANGIVSKELNPIVITASENDGD